MKIIFLIVMSFIDLIISMVFFVYLLLFYCIEYFYFNVYVMMTVQNCKKPERKVFVKPLTL